MTNHIYMAGIKPSRIHIGHLIGFFNEAFKYKNIIFMIADYHKYFHSCEYKKQTTESINICKYINSCNFHYYKQSSYKNIYSDIFFLLSYHCNINKLNKILHINYNSSKNNLGKYIYPFLMFIDVILMSPCTVIVSEDQLHNVRYVKDQIDVFKKTFYDPNINFIINKSKILSLNSELKMSTSNNEDYNIYIDSSFDTVRNICIRAKTQSQYPTCIHDMNKNTFNLFNIMSKIDNKNIEEVINQYDCFHDFKSELSIKLFKYIQSIALNMKNTQEREANVHNRINTNYRKIFTLLH